MVKQKQRHGCLTSSLILMIIANSATALIYLIWIDTIKQTYPAAPGWTFPVLVVFCIFNLVCVIAIFKWKKWGFWGFLFSSIVAIIVNLSIGLGFGRSLLGLMGIVLLYAVLQIGKEKKGWSQME